MDFCWLRGALALVMFTGSVGESVYIICYKLNLMSKLMAAMDTKTNLEVSLKEVIVLLTFLMNIGALIWGAATIASTVENMGVVVSKLEVTTEKLSNTVSDLDGRLRVLEDRGIRNERIPR